MGKDFGAYVLRQLVELRFELVTDLDIPSRQLIMALNTYGVTIIYYRLHLPEPRHIAARLPEREAAGRAGVVGGRDRSRRRADFRSS